MANDTDIKSATDELLDFENEAETQMEKTPEGQLALWVFRKEMAARERKFDQVKLSEYRERVKSGNTWAALFVYQTETRIARSEERIAEAEKEIQARGGGAPVPAPEPEPVVDGMTIGQMHHAQSCADDSLTLSVLQYAACFNMQNTSVTWRLGDGSESSLKSIMPSLLGNIVSDAVSVNRWENRILRAHCEVGRRILEQKQKAEAP